MVESQSAVADRPSEVSAAKQLADVASKDVKHRFGRAPESVTVVVVDDVLVITLRRVLSPSEKIFAKSPAGAALTRKFHQQLFRTSCDSLLQEIEVITGVPVREASMEVAPLTGTVQQVFQLAAAVPACTWNGSTSELISVGPSCSNEERVLDGEG